MGPWTRGPAGFLQRSKEIIETDIIRNELINIVGNDEIVILEFFVILEPGKIGDLIFGRETKVLCYQSFGFRDGKIASSRLVRDLNPLLDSGKYSLEHSEKVEDYLKRLKTLNLA